MKSMAVRASMWPQPACVLLCWGLVVCNRADRISPPEPPAAPVIEAPEEASSAGGLKPIGLEHPPKGGRLTAAEQYAMCKARVEGTDAAGECTIDDDCQRAGCSQELCISATEAALGVMSTCEVRPCYAVLQACGCQEGVCSWSVGD